MKDRSIRLILVFGLLKLLVHFLTNTNYALHRDEYLYFDEGQHLAWGFMEVPPFTPFLASLASVMGGSVFAIRFFPALVGAITIVLAGLLVKKLGGGRWAIVITCFSLLLSPSLLGSNTLFQPVSFNQFFWFLSAYLVVLLVQTKDTRYWYFLGMVMGLGLLNKYSIVFYGLGVFIGLLLTPERKYLKTYHPYLALLIALCFAAPNLYWQYDHNFPVIKHMSELKETQLVNVDWLYFLNKQLDYHFFYSALWIVGILGVFMIDKLKPCRFVAIGFIATIIIIGSLAGKPYYTIGAFTILFPFGGIFLEEKLKKFWLKPGLLVLLFFLSLPTLPYALPLLKLDQMSAYCAWIAGGESGKERWEDGKDHDLPQDYADMTGWEELSQRVSTIYHSLGSHEKEKCVIYGGSYGHAGSLNYFREKYDLPEVYSFNGSYMIWLPDSLGHFEYMIIVEEEPHYESTWFHKNVIMDSIRNPYARERGIIHFRSNPKVDLSEKWSEIVGDLKSEFDF